MVEVFTQQPIATPLDDRVLNILIADGRLHYASQITDRAGDSIPVRYGKLLINRVDEYDPFVIDRRDD